MQFHLLPSHIPVKTSALLILSFCAVLPAWSAGPPQAAKHSVLIVDGMNNHDWARGTRILKEILTASGLFDVDVSTTPPVGATPGDWAKWKPHFRKYNCGISNFT